MSGRRNEKERFRRVPGARAKDWGHDELDLGPGERRKPGLSGLPPRVVFGDERDELETASLASRAGQCVDPEPPLRAAGYSSADLDLRHAFLDNEFLAYRRDQKRLVYQQPTLPVTMKQWDKGKVTITFHAKTTHTGAHARINVFNIVDDQGNPAWAGGAEFFDPVPLNTTWTKHTITMLASDPDFLAPIHSLEFRLGLIQGSAPSEVEAWFDDFDHQHQPNQTDHILDQPA